ncbi:AsnC family transcriptional regulator [Clostridium folliculivorans]|uniref:siroheme decarboxylase n=1 Tax=Clostridium folliculivorans TaxID=2886038 RepID=A0A9W5Y281_9CLOT|nr:AsnC family transcriptional regulator [Clostridium folliculivorans]GKU25240.1 transcriptional regulator [Clostridium folliculivorans]GKU28261.1 transcriptional regulator [Clostridium folliculivorans]
MIDSFDKKIIRKLQENISITATPYKEMADELNISEDELIHRIKTYNETGVLKRVGAILYHRKVGFNANAMVVWRIDNETLDEAGKYMASFSEISHCYERKPCDSWNYNLYSMIHGKDKECCNKIIEKISNDIGVKNYKILYSTKELKKTSMRYFL